MLFSIRPFLRSFLSCTRGTRCGSFVADVPCPLGDLKCRGDVDHAWSIGIGFGSQFWEAGNPEAVVIPIQSCADVTDIPCLYMADPFLIQEDLDTWYLFTEVLNNDCQKGEIALSVSYDGLQSFQYKQIVLTEPWHLSWPFVIPHAGSHFMVTCATAGAPQPGFLWLYESAGSDWPFTWTRKRRILYEHHLSGHALDPVLYYREQTWYLMTLDAGLGQERIYYSDRLDAGYIEHSQSKKYSHRHAGPIIFDAGGLWAFFQTGKGAMSTVSARKISKLDRVEYEYDDHQSEVAGYTDSPFAAQGMHTFGAHRMNDGHWAAIIDGWFRDHEHSKWKCLHSFGKNQECWSEAMLQQVVG